MKTPTTIFARLQADMRSTRPFGLPREPWAWAAGITIAALLWGAWFAIPHLWRAAVCSVALCQG